MIDSGRAFRTTRFLRCGTAIAIGVLFHFVWMSPGVAHAQGDLSSSAELSSLVKNVKGGEGFTGNFVQSLKAPGTPETRSKGTLIYKAPGLMILHYSDPPGQWLKIDGSRMALYVPQNRQVLLKTIRKHRIPETPAILLASIPDITKWFFVRPQEHSSLKGKKISIFLIPRHPDPHLAQAKLTLLKGKGILTDLLFMEQNGTRLSISLTRFKVLSHIPASDLMVSVPKGTTAAEVPGAF